MEDIATKAEYAALIVAGFIMVFIIIIGIIVVLLAKLFSSKFEEEDSRMDMYDWHEENLDDHR